ncbi:type II CRISPR RNA-guided endonuclease Cas9 [Apilactobacillus sp. TMW 2.2459]|uniref:type II CRISPR RNA-guided endonuclease Cas9 n=1 Tax=Apilactobacillus xinyiensis TaxID=2841032 RepID=UPI00200BD57B|nr:type II CRISPR RNA-guided endonuclease Cas9 [Apilactobacillus xinyiensis]MCL0312535.1 type II CRISPR RNA-guided endonuclease Cas9 [Apilactobacillus xinyiensis]
MKYIIGLDVGITSIGYAIIRLDINNNPDKIIFMNSIIFPLAENGKGDSLANERGELRRLRRINRRKKFRKHRVKQLFIRNNLLTKENINDVLNKDIYQLRVDGLDRQLNPKELFKVLYWLVGHRGFKSNRKAELKNKDIGKLLTSLAKTNKELETKGYRTVGELYLKSPKFMTHKRNKFYDDGYIGSSYRKLIVDEATKILDAQIKQPNSIIDNSFKDDYIEILTSQRDYDEGPGKNSPFAGNQIEKMIGHDSFNPKRQRGAKATYTFHYFDLLSNLNNLKYRLFIGDDFKTLNDNQRTTIIEKALKNKKTNFEQVKKYLKIPKEAEFNLVNYSKEKAEKNTILCDFTSVQNIKACLHKEDLKNNDLVDNIGEIITKYKSDKSRTNALKEIGIQNKDVIDKILFLNASQFSKLSLSTMKEIIPFLEKGQLYSEAAENAGYNFNEIKIDDKYIHDNVKNPVVKRAVSNTIKMVKRITKKYGKPNSIHIELARELGKSLTERKKITDIQEKNKTSNDTIAEEIESLGFEVNGQNILTMKLYHEQKGIDPYSLNSKPIKIEDALSNNDSYEIDHIIPYSISFDDSYTNKVLVSTKANREKGNRIPMEYLKNNPEAQNWLTVQANKLSNKRKREKLLKTNLSEDEKSNWKSRNIKDTQYMNKLLNSYLQQNIEFDSDDNHRKVIALNGAVTAKIRSRWGINKHREESDIHHAIDAVVIACITQSYIQKVTNYSKNKELKYNKDLWTPQIKKELQSNASEKTFKSFFNDFPLPWVQFREELFGRISENPKLSMCNKNWNNYSSAEIDALKPIFVVRQPNKKISGAIHNDTIKSPKKLSEGIVEHRVALNELKINKKGNIVTGKAEYVKKLDGGNEYVWQLIFDKLSLLKKLTDMKESVDKDDKAEKDNLTQKIDGVFPNNSLEYKKNGHTNIIRKVKVQQKCSNGVLLNHDTEFADNAKGSMLRIDVFKTDKDKYAFVPIYRCDITNNKAPNKIAGHVKNPYEVSQKDTFIFSLYPYDMVHIIFHKPKKVSYKNNGKKFTKTINEFYGYYNSADASTGSIKIMANDNSYSVRGIGVASLHCFEKYTVDYFGDFYKVNEKHRQWFK